VTGRLGESLSLEQGQDAARLCGLNLLAQLREACGGDLDRAARCLRLNGFVCAAAGFVEHPKVVNGASDLMFAVMAEGGRHTRIAVGVSTLPLDAAVEIDGIFELA
jgi:enamine deaminase RidA (YjgF/YER057c/UK114 family)